jgi:outer membrane receptor protein involved in Fe transport
MIRTSEDFWFNGVDAKTFGITNINVDDGSSSNSLLQEPFLGSRTINEERLKWNPKPYFYNSQEACKTFNLSFGFDRNNSIMMNKAGLRRIAMWFGDTRQYHELWFAEDCFLDGDGNYDINNPRRIYRVMLTGDSTVNHFGLSEGYVSLSLKTDSPYCYSPIFGGRVWSEDERANDNDGSYVYFGNYADMVIKPQIRIIVGQKDPDNPTDDPHNQSIKIIGQKIEDNQLPPITYDGFQRDYPYTPTDYTKFPSFEFSGGVKATGFFQLLGTVFYGEKFYLGDKTYEFDLGMGKPYNKNEINNILVPINDGVMIIAM